MATGTIDATYEGSVYKSHAATLVNWTADVRNATNGSNANTYGVAQTQNAAIRIGLQSSRNGYQGIGSRTYLFFDDTDSVTGGGTITSATLKVYAASQTEFFHTILVEGTAWGDDGSTTTMSTSDWSELDFTNEYSNELTTWSSGYNTYTLTAAAINDMNSNKYLNAVLIEGEYDYDNSNPSLGTQISAAIKFKDGNFPHELILTYSPPGFGENISGVVSANINKIVGVVRSNVIKVIDTPTGLSIFNSNIGIAFDHYVYSIAEQSDGKFIVVGGFETFKSSTKNGIIRLNSNGTEDTSFYTNIGTGFRNGTSRSFQYNAVVQSDGKILVGGNFDTLNGNTRKRLVRLNSNGTVDTSFYTNLGTGFNNFVRRVVIQSDGKILVLGGYSQFKGNARKGLVRLNSNGTEDTSFYTNLGTAFNHTSTPVINTAAIQSDGKIIIGGKFTSFKGNTRNYLIRLNSNGTEDTSFYTNLGSSFSLSSGTAQVEIVTIQPDGKILVGGAFDSFNGSTRRKLVRLNSNGTADNSFNSNLGSGFNTGYTVSSIKVVGSSFIFKILVGGDFWNFNGNTTSNNGQSTVGLVRLDSSGNLDTSFELLGMTFSSKVNDFEVTTGSSIIVGGDFTPTINGTTRNHLLEINLDGSVDS